MTPRSPDASAGCTLIFAAASRIALKVPTRLIFTARSKLASACGPLRPTTRSPGATPAQLTRPWTAPKVETHRSTAACVDASSVTSVRTKRTVPPRKPSRSLPAASFTSAMTTLPPLAASSVAVAAPSPEPPPVTRNTWFSIFMDAPSGIRAEGGLAHGDDGKVVLARPFFPVARVVAREKLREAFRGKARQRELLREAFREMGLEGGDCDPSPACGVKII